MAKVLIPLANGFEDIEALTCVDVLRRGGVEVVTASVRPVLDVRSAHGVTVCADALFSDVADAPYDAIVLPGGGEGTANLKSCISLVRRLKRQHEEGRLICAICAAPTILVSAGVLDEGTQVTCYPSCQAELDRPWVPSPVVVDKTIVTGQAPGSALLFALVVLRALMGEPVAHKVAQGMVTGVLM